MRNLLAGIGAALLLLIAGCKGDVPSRSIMLREMYFAHVAEHSLEWHVSHDTLSFKAYVSSTSDNAEWRRIESDSWKALRVEWDATLATLGYGTGPFTWDYGSKERGALRRFQLDIGLPATGKVDSATIRGLTEARQVNRPSIALPRKDVFRDGAYFHAVGTWKAVTNSLAYPANTVAIECDASRRICRVAGTQYVDQDLNRLARIQSWELPVIRATPDMLVAGDGDILLTINVPAGAVSWVQQSTGYVTERAVFSGARDALPSPRQQSGGETVEAAPDSLHPARMALKLVDGATLGLADVHDEMREEYDRLFATRDKFLKLREKNTYLK